MSHRNIPSRNPLSQEKYEALLNITGTGVYEIDVTDKSGVISDSLGKLINHTPTQHTLSLDEFLNFISEKHRNDVRQGLIKAIDKKENFLQNFQLNHDSLWVKSKGSFWKENLFILTLTPLQFQPESARISVSGGYSDIFDSLPTPVMLISDDGLIRYINKTLTEITGFTHEEIPTLEHWLINTSGDKSDNLHEIIDQLFNITGYQRNGEFRFRTKSKVIKELEFYSAPLGKDEDGRELIMTIAADVTETRKKDDLIKQQAEELKVLTDKLPHLIFTANTFGKIEYLNERWIKFTGISEPQMKENIRSIVHPDDLRNLLEQARMSRDNNKELDMDVRVKNKAQQYRWLNIRAVPVKNSVNFIVKWIGTGTDVHDRYEAEQKLLHKANEFIGLVEMLDHHVWVINANGTPEYFNRAWYKYTGLTEKQTFEDRMQVIHPSQREKVKYQVDTAWKKGVPYEISLKMRRHDGEYQWFLTKGRPILNTHGEILKYIGTITNIHTHRQLEDALKHEVSVLSEIIESIPLMAWTADAEGSVDYYNKRWYEYTLQSPDEAMGWGWKNVAHPEDVNHTMDTILQALSSGKGFESETRFLRASDGNFRWHLLKVTPVKELSGKIKYWIGTATDIHEQKVLEQKKGQFLNIASHELRTPLTTLMGYIQLMELAVEDNNVNDIKKFLEKSSYSSQRMNRLINDLLNLSHVDSGKIADFHKEKIEVNEFLSNIIENYHQLHPEIKFNFNPASNKVFVNANSFRLEQVLDNLLSNAIKYAPRSPIFLNVTEKGSEVQVSVKDKGKGIPEDKLKAIFDRFYRVRDNGTTSGLGIGLFISKEIISEHDGKMWAENDNGSAAFHFTLPKV